MALAIGHLVAQYRACAAARTEPFSETVAASLDDLCARLGDAAHDTEQLVLDDPAIVLAGLRHALADIADLLAEDHRHDDELLARRITLDLHTATGTLQHTRDLSAFARPLTALGHTDEARDARREAFTALCALAAQEPTRWLDALAEAVAYGDLLVAAGDPAAATEACRRAVHGLAPYAESGMPWAVEPYAQALLSLAQRTADAGDPVGALEAAQEAVVLLERESPVVLAAALHSVGLRHEELKQWEDARVHLAEAAELLADAEDAATNRRRAELLGDLARVQSHLDGDAAVETAKQCVELHRGIVGDEPGHLPHLALALVELHHRLAATGRHVKAVYALQESAAHYRQLREQDPQWTADLAHCHLFLGQQLAELGRREPALEETTTAVALLRDCPEEALALARALRDLGTRFHDLGRTVESLAANGEAAGIFRDAGNLPALGMVLYNVAVTHHFADQIEEAVPAAVEAVEVYQRLYDKDSGWAPDLAQALARLGKVCERADRFDQAITAMERAVSLLQRLHTPGSDNYGAELAQVLHDLSRYHEQQGRLDRSLEHMRRSVALYGDLTQGDPERFRRQLAGSWLSLGIYLTQLDQDEEARSATGLAADLYRQADDQQGLALALVQLSARESALNRAEESTAALTEAVELYEELALQWPDPHLGNLAMTLENLATRHSRQQDHGAALPLLERATRIWGQLGNQSYLVGNLRSRLLVEYSLGRDTEDTLERLTDNQHDLEETIRTLDGTVQDLIRADLLRPAEQLLDRVFGLWEIHLLEHPDSDPMLRLVLLDSRALLLARSEQHAEAAATQDETIRLLEPFALEDPDGYLGTLAAARSRLSRYLRAADRPAEALEQQGQVVSVYEQLAAQVPGVYRPALVSALHNLGELLHDLGSNDADAVLARAATLRLTLGGEED
ncbi:tetratricopeptide repeat protein [Streptomyces sp. NPDC052107]|uniref:tetratricopeptide repeat protein n=1 Tax=Streptomyces sp. NPDC052107 TaxID=3155632 RepID=UPI003447A198